MSNRGRRYNEEEKLNYKKVFAFVVAIFVIIMFVIMVKNLISKADTDTNKANLKYYALYANEAWGILGSNGETIIEPMYQEMITVINSNRDVFLCVYDVNEETGKYKTKVVNKENKQLYETYENIEALENYDEAGNMWYEEDMLKVEKDGKYGLINIDGKEILSIQYDDIQTLKEVENSLIVKKGGLYGLVNNSGVKIIEPKYSKIEKFGSKAKKAYITVDEDGKYGLVNTAGTQILENKYEKIVNIYGENYFIIEEDEEQKVIDSNGEVILEDCFDKVVQLCSKGCVFEEDDKYGYMTYDGEIEIEAEYDDLKQVNTDIFVAKKDDEYGIIDVEEEEKLEFKYSNIYYEEGAAIYIAEDEDYNSVIIDSDFNVKLIGILSELNINKTYMKMKIGDEYKYYNFKFEEKDVTEILSSNTLFVSKKNGKYGFVDKEGKVVVDYIYEEATEQNSNGYAGIKKNGLWGAIDQTGKVIVEPKYDLKDNLEIDFVGKWHLGRDLNMNYYCEK